MERAFFFLIFFTVSVEIGAERKRDCGGRYRKREIIREEGEIFQGKKKIEMVGDEREREVWRN